MKVLGIVCSPRKNGNTEILVEEALAAAREYGAETEIFLIAGKTNIQGCDGCEVCRKTDVCRIKDDVTPLYARWEAADGIIFGSPVYFNGVTAQAKAIIDRTFMYARNRKLVGKVAGTVLAVRRIGAGQTRSHLYGYFISQGMVAVRAAIGFGIDKGAVRDSFGGTQGWTALEEAHKCGKDVVEMIQRLAANKK
jgi:multimeric flavodoxin WrbA